MKMNHQKRTRYFVMPLLVLPFATFAFWALGGGKGKQSKQTETGLNLSLPVSKEEKTFPDKLSFYELAQKDSIKRAEYLRSDPYYAQDTAIFSPPPVVPGKQPALLAPLEGRVIAPEDELEQKLQTLQAALSNVQEQPKKVVDLAPPSHEISAEVDRLEALVQSVNDPGQEDPELRQINQTLDKLLQVQNPGKKLVVHEEKSRNIQKVFAKEDIESRGFYFLNTAALADTANSIPAVVDQEMQLVDGSQVRLRLQADLFTGKWKVPAGTAVMGQASLRGERLEIEVTAIRIGHSIIEVHLEVFDLDGMPGLYVPGAIAREVVRESASNGIQGLELSQLDASARAQAAAVGMGTIKSLLSRKSKEVMVTVRQGYQVLLKNKN